MSARCRFSLLVTLSLLAGSTILTPAIAKDKDDDRCAGSRDVRLVNGKIHTLDAKNSIVSSVTIQNGKIASVGNDGDPSGGPCMQVINLGGRTAIPGLVDNHNHFLLLGLRPGHDTRLETAAWPMDHRDGRLDAGAICRKPPADACRIGCRSSKQPRACV